MDGFGFSSSVGSSTGGGIIEKTYAEIIILMAASGLTAGSFYKITDRGDRWLLFQAVSTSQLATDGQRLMLCPADYAIEIDAYGNNWIGVWNDTKSVVIDDLTIWGGLVWKNLTGVIGTASDNVTLDAVNWVVIPKTSFANHEYIEMLFGCQYDWVNDYTVKQWDDNDNVFVYDPDYGDVYNYCDISDWNYSSSGDLFVNNNCRGIYNNVAGDIYDNTCTSTIYNNVCSGEIASNIAGRIASNVATGISMNIMFGGSGNIDGNNAGLISVNICEQISDVNTTGGSITYNRIGGYIQGVTSVALINIDHNTNNGNITGAQIADVTDPIVNK
jgi:hypothetical protein